MSLIPEAPRVRWTLEGYARSWGVSVELLSQDEQGHAVGPGEVVGTTVAALWRAWAEAHAAGGPLIDPEERAAESLHAAIVELVGAREDADTSDQTDGADGCRGDVVDLMAIRRRRCRL